MNWKYHEHITFKVSRYLKSILTFNFKKRNLRILIQTTVSIPGVLFCLFLLSFGSSYPVFSLLVSCLSLCVYKGSSALCDITHCYNHWCCEPVCQTQTSQYSLVLAEGEVWMLLRESASILWWSQGIYTANTQTGSYPNHINMIVTNAAPLHTNGTLWSQKTGRGLPGTQINIFFFHFAEHKTYFTRKYKSWLRKPYFLLSHQYLLNLNYNRIDHKRWIEDAARVTDSSQASENEWKTTMRRLLEEMQT